MAWCIGRSKDSNENDDNNEDNNFDKNLKKSLSVMRWRMVECKF